MSTSRHPCTSPGHPRSLCLQAGEHQPAPSSFHTLLSLFLLPRVTWATLASLEHRDPRYCAWGGFLGCEGCPTCIADWRQSCCLGARVAPKWGERRWHLGSSQSRAVPQLEGACQPPTTPRMLARHSPPSLRFALWHFEAQKRVCFGGVGCPHPTGRHPILCATLLPAYSIFFLFHVPEVGVKVLLGCTHLPATPLGTRMSLGVTHSPQLELGTKAFVIKVS